MDYRLGFCPQPIVEGIAHSPPVDCYLLVDAHGAVLSAAGSIGMLNWLNRQGGVLGFVFFLIGTAFTLYTWMDTKVSKRILYNVESRKVFTSLDGLSPKWVVSGRDIVSEGADVYETQVVIWNAGDATIEGKDFRSPITVSGLNSDKVLFVERGGGVSLVRQLPVVDIEKKQATISYDVFDPGMAVAVRVFHTGTAVGVSYKFGPGIEFRRYEFAVNKSQAILVAAFMLAFFVIGIGMLIAANREVARQEDSSEVPIARRSGVIAGFMIFILISIVVSANKYLRDPRPPVAWKEDFQERRNYEG